ncbi:MAG TPA: substrate-binding domain-containing protein [Lachnospiraceae bacterium]|nr:substrate-binding domain-containing protein [Lachnospiraceae bacterium]
MMRKSYLVLLLAAVIFCAGGCKNAEEDNEKTVEVSEDKLEIGMSFDSFIIERWQRDRDVFVSTAKELGAEVNVQTANGEVDEQISQIEYFIDKDVDVIVVVPIDADKLEDVIGKAKKAGIPVMCYDRVARNSNADLFISFDNEEVGALMAAALYGAAGRDADVVMVCGPETDYNVEMVGEGFDRVTKEYHGNIIGSFHCDAWRAETAYEYVNENMQLFSQADAIMCGNDSLAGEVIRALSEMRLAGKIPVVGQDADLEACQRIVEGTQLMTVYKPVEKLAKKAAEYAVRLAKHEELTDTDTFYDGKYNIPYVKLEPVRVTKDNMDEAVISSGFHLKEDVYMNVSQQNQ